jgi:hypothetical protein
LLHAAQRARRTLQDFHFPLLRLRVARIHAEQFARKQSGFIAARARANFDDHVLLVVRILRQQQEFQLALDRFPALGQLLLFVLREQLHLRVVRFKNHLFGFSEALVDHLPLTVFCDHIGKLRMPARELLERARIGMHFRRGKLRRHFHVAVFNLVELFVER